jgi:hypothetical protein
MWAMSDGLVPAGIAASKTSHEAWRNRVREEASALMMGGGPVGVLLQRTK